MCGRFTHSYTRGSTTAFVGWPFPILGLDNSLAFRYVSWPEGYLHPFRVNNSAHLKKGQGNAD
jgi:hypothetical protein